MTTSPLQHKVVVITGANRGIGFEFTNQLLFTEVPSLELLSHSQHCGRFTVVATTRIIDQNHWSPIQEKLQAFNKQHESTPGYIPRELSVQQCDVTNITDIQNLCEFVRDQLSSRIDLLIANAGIIEPNPSTTITDLKSFDPAVNIFTTNSIAPIILTNNLIPFLITALTNLSQDQSSDVVPTAFDSTINPGVNLKQGTPTNSRQVVQCVYISSTMGSLALTNMPLCPTYRASKCALNMYIKTLAIQYPKISFLPLSPGWVATDMGSRGGRTPPTTPKDSVSGMFNQMNLHCFEMDSAARIYSFDDEDIPW